MQYALTRIEHCRHGTCFSNKVGQVQPTDYRTFSLDWKSTSNYSIAVAASASPFPFQYSLHFDDSPKAACQQA